MYKCKHFKIYELVPKELYEMLHEDLLWKMFDENILKAFDWIKEEYSPDDPVTINNWYWGGTFSQSGIRTKNSKYYSRGSKHSVACAGDLKFKVITPEEIRKDIQKRIADGETIPYIKRIENGTDTWLHIDTGVAPRGKESSVYFFNP